jgi:hypothetical protein
MSNEQTYNGWKNYQTWVVNLWFDNDGFNEMFEEWAKECIEDNLDSGDASDIRSNAKYDLAKRIEEYADELQEMSNIQTSGMFADLLTNALGNVYWDEIAEHYTDEVELWSTGYNMPGCLPDNDPQFFTDFDDAQSSIVETMRGYAEEMDLSCERESKELESLADAFEESKEQELSQQGANGLVYWINKA